MLLPRRVSLREAGSRECWVMDEQGAPDCRLPACTAVSLAPQTAVVLAQ